MEEIDSKKKTQSAEEDLGLEKLRSRYELRKRGVMGEDEPWGFEWTEKREDVRRRLRWHIQGLLGVGQEWQGESRRENGDAEQLPPRPRSSPVRSELAAAAQEQLGFRSVTAAASVLAPVNEAEDAAELRDSPQWAGPEVPAHWPRPSAGLVF